MSITNFLAQGDSRFVLSEVTEGSGPTNFDLLDVEMNVDGHAGMDVFLDNNGNGGQGTLGYHEPDYYQFHQQHLSPPPAFHPGHQSRTSLHGAALPAPQDQRPGRSTDHDESPQQPTVHNQVSQQDFEQVQASDVSTETIAESVRHGTPARVEDPEAEPEDVANALKTEAADSDDQEFEEESEDEEGDGTDDEKKKRRKYNTERKLTRWNTGVDQLFLLSLIYELELRGVDIPYAAAALHVNPASSAQSVEQHLTKVRRARIFFGMPVPPPKNHVAEELDPVTEKIAKVYNTITFTKSGHEDKIIEGTPGSIPISYTPLPNPDRPHLPHYGDANHPPVVPADKNKKSRFTKSGVKAMKREKDDEYVRHTPVEKKSNSSKKVTKTESRDDPTIKKPSARKPLATPSKASKPQGVTKSKKTPSSISKPLSSLALNSPLAGTPSKKALRAASAKKAADGTKTGSSKKAKTKTKTDKISDNNDGSTETKSAPVLLNGVTETGQTYGRISKDAPATAFAQLGNYFDDIPEDRFTLGRAEARKSYETDSTVISEPNTRTAQQLVQTNHHNQNASGNQLAHNVMGTGFAHGHQSGLSNADFNLAHGHQPAVPIGNPGLTPGLSMQLPSQAQWNAMMTFFSQANAGYVEHANNAYSNGQQAMDLNTPTLTPRDDLLLNPGLNGYHTAGGVANGSSPMIQQPQQYLPQYFQQPSLYQPQPQQQFQPYFVNGGPTFDNDEGKLETEQLVDPAINFTSFNTNNTFPPKQ
ncbi:hypothetical protein E4T39_02187 [Aureobasidium subglaciale]|nr:hypothetical protein E4T39_02187 [Aureobasidium subglaciale]